ncbi:hypothetical protein [Streptomyces bobili]|uniref:Uncharacterized protein n=1 Tax=Streptomyces bobili TaxID=67280 RepID=A0ABZ1R041_9ACTN|nr:hypothetical protein [Streptomyces bobili]
MPTFHLQKAQLWLNDLEVLHRILSTQSAGPVAIHAGNWTADTVEDLRAVRSRDLKDIQFVTINPDITVDFRAKKVHFGDDEASRNVAYDVVRFFDSSKDPWHYMFYRIEVIASLTLGIPAALLIYLNFDTVYHVADTFGNKYDLNGDKTLAKGQLTALFWVYGTLLYGWLFFGDRFTQVRVEPHTQTEFRSASLQAKFAWRSSVTSGVVMAIFGIPVTLIAAWSAK